MATRTLPVLAVIAVMAFSNTPPAPVELPSADDAAVIEWAEARFAGAGLTLPEIDVIVFDDLLDCGGHVGMYHPGRRLLELCRVDAESVLHELAHAWADFNLDEAARQSFVAHRGLAGWNEREDDWEMRATEHAAEIVVWALLETDTTVKWVEDGVVSYRLLTIPDSSPERLAAGFTALTGLAEPGYRTVGAEQDVVDYSPEARLPQAPISPDSE